MIGWVLGMLLTLGGLALLRYLEHRNRLDLGAVAYALLVSLRLRRSMACWAQRCGPSCPGLAIT